jgi:quercetin dioxygenase-like cupin family protein
MGFVDIEQQRPIELAPGVRLRTPHGEKLMLSLVEIEHGAEVPLHSHPHEQGGILISGTMDLTIGKEHKRLYPGDMYIIPGNVPHRAVAVNGPVVAMDVFSPIREDYAQLQSRFLKPTQEDTKDEEQ